MKVVVQSRPAEPVDELREYVLQLIENLAEFVDGKRGPLEFSGTLARIRERIMEGSE